MTPNCASRCALKFAAFSAKVSITAIFTNSRPVGERLRFAGSASQSWLTGGCNRLPIRSQSMPARPMPQVSNFIGQSSLCFDGTVVANEAGRVIVQVTEDAQLIAAGADLMPREPSAGFLSSTSGCRWREVPPGNSKVDSLVRSRTEPTWATAAATRLPQLPN